MTKLSLWLMPIIILIWLLSAPQAYAKIVAPTGDFCISNKINGAYIDSSGENLIVEYSGIDSTPTLLNIQKIGNIQVNASSAQALNLGENWAFRIQVPKPSRDLLNSEFKSSTKTQVSIDYSSDLQKPNTDLVTCRSQRSDVQLARITPQLEQKVNEAIQKQAQAPGAAASAAPPVAHPASPNPPGLNLQSKPCDPNDKAAEAKFGPCPAGIGEFEQIFSKIITVIVGLAFVVMLVMLIWGGIKYLTSGGEPKAIQSAHYTVTWALLGVLFMAVAWLILQLIRIFTGIDVTIFNIRVLI
ncbi:hypothetical protein HYW41_00660 [Candidatus Daviesbacteria bacterium]|nr:hypothetical protein [Candidatus Daviesbacteria bacterium]